MPPCMRDQLVKLECTPVSLIMLRVCGSADARFIVFEVPILSSKGVERNRAENERPIVTVAKHRTVTLLPTSVVRSSGELSASVEREFAGDASVGDEQGVPALPTLPFITSSVTASPLEEGGDRTDSATGPSLRTIGPSARFVVLSDSSHHSGAKSADLEVDSLVRSAAPVMTEAITVATVATTVAIPADVSKDKSAPHTSVFGSSSSSEKTDRTLSLFIGRSGSGFDAGSIRAEEAVGASSEGVSMFPELS
ncbi:hypothetical protein Tco_1562399 [Tanacetum coccineum]